MTCSSYSPAKLIHDFKRLTVWLSVRLLLCCVCILNCASLINKYIILYQPPYKIDISLVYLTFANMGKNKNTANAFSTNCICKLLFFPCLSVSHCWCYFLLLSTHSQPFWLSKDSKTDAKSSAYINNPEILDLTSRNVSISIANSIWLNTEPWSNSL